MKQNVKPIKTFKEALYTNTEIHLSLRKTTACVQKTTPKLWQMVAEVRRKNQRSDIKNSKLVDQPSPFPHVPPRSPLSCCTQNLSGFAWGFLDRNHTFMGSFFPFMVTGPRYSRWNWGSAFSADCKHLQQIICQCLGRLGTQACGEELDLPVGELGDVYPALFTRRLCAAGEVDGVSEQAVARHPLADHPRHHLSGVDPDGDLERANHPQVAKTPHGRWEFLISGAQL